MYLKEVENSGFLASLVFASMQEITESNPRRLPKFSSLKQNLNDLSLKKCLVPD